MSGQDDPGGARGRAVEVDGPDPDRPRVVSFDALDDDTDGAAPQGVVSFDDLESDSTDGSPGRRPVSFDDLDSGPVDEGIDRPPASFDDLGSSSAHGDADRRPVSFEDLSSGFDDGSLARVPVSFDDVGPRAADDGRAAHSVSFDDLDATGRGSGGRRHRPDQAVRPRPGGRRRAMPDGAGSSETGGSPAATTVEEAGHHDQSGGVPGLGNAGPDRRPGVSGEDRGRAAGAGSRRRSTGAAGRGLAAGDGEDASDEGAAGHGGHERGRGRRGTSRAGGARLGGGGRASAADAPQDDEARAKEICLRLLTDRARTVKELADALRRKEIPDDVAGRVLERFDEVGLVDDEAFAGQWVRARHQHKGLGRRAIAAELHRKGVAKDVADEALTEIDAESEEVRARELVARKLRAMRVDTKEDRASSARRLVGMLARKGYGSGVAYAVVREAIAARGAEEDELGEGPTDD